LSRSSVGQDQTAIPRPVISSRAAGLLIQVRHYGGQAMSAESKSNEPRFMALLVRQKYQTLRPYRLARNRPQYLI